MEDSLQSTLAVQSCVNLRDISLEGPFQKLAAGPKRHWQKMITMTTPHCMGGLEHLQPCLLPGKSVTFKSDTALEPQATAINGDMAPMEEAYAI